MSFADSDNRKLIKEIFALFLSHQQQTLKDEESLQQQSRSIGQIINEQQSQEEREKIAAEIFQV